MKGNRSRETQRQREIPGKEGKERASERTRLEEGLARLLPPPATHLLPSPPIFGGGCAAEKTTQRKPYHICIRLSPQVAGRAAVNLSISSCGHPRPKAGIAMWYKDRGQGRQLLSRHPLIARGRPSTANECRVTQAGGPAPSPLIV